jgi:hypothetical protein
VEHQAEQEGKDGTRLSVGDFNEAGVPAQTSIFVPRHHLAEELREVIEAEFRERGEPITVPILRGRENGGEEGNAPCRRWREARELARKGLPITRLSRRVTLSVKIIGAAAIALLASASTFAWPTSSSAGEPCRAAWPGISRARRASISRLMYAASPTNW